MVRRLGSAPSLVSSIVGTFSICLRSSSNRIGFALVPNPNNYSFSIFFEMFMWNCRALLYQLVQYQLSLMYSMWRNLFSRLITYPQSRSGALYHLATPLISFGRLSFSLAWKWEFFPSSFSCNCNEASLEVQLVLGSRRNLRDNV